VSVKKNVVRVVRVIVSVGLLAWVLRAADLGNLVHQISNARVEWLLAAFAVNSVGNLFGAWRWQLLLRSQGRHVPVFHLFGSYLVGLFFNNFLPSTIGGDVVRAASAKKKGGGTLTENLTVVLVERMIGLFATLTLGGLAALTGVAGKLDPRVPWLLGGALFVSMAGIYLAISRRVRARLLPLVERIPVAFVRDTVAKMIAAFDMFSRARPTLVANYALSLTFQLLLIVHFWLLQFAFGEHVPFVTFIVVVPLVFCVMILPIGINGLGVRETAFVWFMTRAGMQPAPALAISLASYAVAVAQGVLGGAVHLTREVGRKDGGRPDADTEPEPAAES
jgi:uncharacterized protein (TIRG00374 family)